MAAEVLEVPGSEGIFADLITTYQDANSSFVEELAEEPSALEFMRYVARNRPFVLRGGAMDWKPCQEWTLEYLIDVMGDQPVNVAITPHGNADSILEHDGKRIFVKPYETEQPFSKVIKDIQNQELEGRQPDDTVKYAQTQNDNLRNEYSLLADDLPSTISFAELALQTPPDAVNLWIGNSHSVTALHKDPYENIYVQVMGRKHFVLIPSLAVAGMGEEMVLGMTYSPSSHTDSQGASDLVPVLDDPPSQLPFPTFDPDAPSRSRMANPTPHTHLVQPLRVTLEKGDMLYLPALWYHKVSQSCGEEGVCVAVNYWFDMDYSGPLWGLVGMLRAIGGIGGGTESEHV